MRVASFLFAVYLVSQLSVTLLKASPVAGEDLQEVQQAVRAAREVHGHDHVAPTKSPVEVFNEQVRHEVHHLYTTFDLNNDGAFTRDDLPLFIHFYDSDGNGTVEREEYETNFDMQEPTLALVANGLFIEFDADQSAHIDLTDMNALYNRMDLNKDGDVERKEFEEYMTEVMTILVILHLQGHEFS